MDRHANYLLNNRAGRVAAALRGVAARVPREEGCEEAAGRVAGIRGSGAADCPAGIVGGEVGGGGGDGGGANANVMRNGSGYAIERCLRDGRAGWRAKGLCHRNDGGAGAGFGPWLAGAAAAEAADTGDDVDQVPRFVEENSTPPRRFEPNCYPLNDGHA